VRAFVRGRGLYAVLGALLVAIAGTTIVLAAGDGKTTGEIGPATHIQPSGRELHPVGKTTELGNLPTGGGLTRDGRFLWTLSAGRGANDVRIVRVLPRKAHCKQGKRGKACRKRGKKSVGKVVQTIPMPGLSGGMAMDPTRNVAYVSGTPATTHADGAVSDDVPGKSGDVIHVFTYDPKSGQATRNGLIELPPPSGTLPPQSFPPTDTDPISWPRDVAVSPDGSQLLVALNLANAGAIVDVKSGAVSYVSTGRYPYGAAITSDGKTGLVSSETEGTVSAIDMKSGNTVATITVGPHLSHPESIAIDPRKPLAYVAVNSQDMIAVVNTNSFKVVRTLSVGRPQGIGTSPVHLSVTPDGCRLLSSDAGEDAIAIFALRTARKCERPVGKHKRRLADRAERIVQHEARVGFENANTNAAEAAEVFGDEAEETADEKAAKAPAERKSKRFSLLGRVPVASYPAAAFATPGKPGKSKLVWIAAKGLGAGRNDAQGRTLPEDPGSATSGAPAAYRFDYLPSNTFGMSGVLPFPDTKKLKKLTPKASQQLIPSNAQKAPADTPLRPDGPIKHVFYIVRENRSYDQILGDDPRGDGDPQLTLFGKDITPNVHALAQRFPLLDHVYANSEASIDGHFWTSAGAVSDYVVKSWNANYADRKRPYDFGVYSVTWPSQRFLFDQAAKQGISYFNYGEAVAGTLPLTDLDRTPEETSQVLGKFANSDIGPLSPGPQPPPPAGCYSNDASIGKNVITMQDTFDSSLPPGVSPANNESRFDCFSQRFDQQLASPAGVPTFNYLTLPSDHTEGTSPGRRTPNAMIADNDYAVGQVVDKISHSSIWNSSLILVLEDDSQDGADHVDAHRIPALAISPYTQRGAVVHDRYDFLSFIRTLELVTGMKSLNLFDATAVPLYDAFDSDPSDNSEPYDAIVPNVDRNERNPAAGPAAKQSAALPLTLTDRVPQPLLDSILWKYVHGADAVAPPPGPNASGIDTAAWKRSDAADYAKGIAEVRAELIDAYRKVYGRAAASALGHGVVKDATESDSDHVDSDDEAEATPADPDD
jgi:DNA-binding beta-propeller fold protein YncE